MASIFELQKMKPIEAFQALLWRISIGFTHRLENIPGAIVKSMPETFRNALSKLTSEDIGSKIRLEPWWQGNDDWHKKQEIKKELVAFDKKILK
jgi:hypothetical protein